MKTTSLTLPLLASLLFPGVLAVAAPGVSGKPKVSPASVSRPGGKHLCPKCNKSYAPSFRFCEVDGAALLTPPTAPTQLAAISGKGMEIILTWKSTPGTSVMVERKRANGAYSALGKAVTGADAFTDRSAPPGERMIYRVRAVNKVGASSYSNEAEAMAVPPVPGTPEGLTAKALPGGRIALEWKAVKGANSFEIQRRNGTLFETVARATEPKFTDTSLSPETAYAYRIRAANSGGESTFTAEVGTTTLAAAPSAPQNLFAQAMSQGQVRLEWTDTANNEEQVLVERKEPKGTFTQVAELEESLTTFVDTGVQPGGRYIYRVRTANAGGYSAYSAEQVAEVPSQAVAMDELVPADPAMTVRAVPSVAKLAPGEVVPVEFHFRFPNSSGDQLGQMVERWYSFHTPDGKKLMAAEGMLPTKGELPANGSWSWKDRPMLPGDVAKKAREAGHSVVFLRQSYRGKRADGTPMVWSTTITMELKAGK